MVIVLLFVLVCIIMKTIELRHEKTCFMHMQKNEEENHLHGNRTANQGLDFCYIDSTISLIPA